MIKGKKVLCVIPARAGSKRVPKKNIKPFAGKPLISWTIEAAKNSNFIDDIFVSTDSLEISKISEAQGVNATPLRPDDLSTDTATTLDVLKYICNQKNDFHYLILLQPTSPLRTVVHINEAIELFEKSNERSLVSLCRSEVHPSWLGRLEDNHAENILKSMVNSRTQDLEEFYHFNGAIYIFDRDLVINKSKILDESSLLGYVMDKSSSLDIDTPEDFLIAEAVAQSLFK